jgi:ketosteroid isomerase-like protein
MTAQAEHAVIETIRRLEDQRGRALVTADWNALGALLPDDLVHIHANGVTEDRSSYLNSMQGKLKFLSFERESLDVRCYSDVAVATGKMKQTLLVRDSGAIVEMRAVTTQVWVRKGDQWMQASFQATVAQKPTL